MRSVCRWSFFFSFSFLFDFDNLNSCPIVKYGLSEALYFHKASPFLSFIFWYLKPRPRLGHLVLFCLVWRIVSFIGWATAPLAAIRCRRQALRQRPMIKDWAAALPQRYAEALGHSTKISYEIVENSKSHLFPFSKIYFCTSTSQQINGLHVPGIRPTTRNY